MNLPSEAVGLVPLSLLLLLALILAARSSYREERVRRILLPAALALAMQLLHMAEEYLGRFHQRFPQLWGLDGWSDQFFLTFNLAWIALWTAAILGLALGWRSFASIAVIWFLAIVACANGVAHPALSLIVGAAFPGVWTSLPLGLAGVLLVKALRAAWMAPPVLGLEAMD